MKAPRSDQSRTRLPLEASDQIVLCSHAPSSTHLHCVVVFGGQLDLTRLKQALDLSLDAEPLLSCRFVPHWLNPYWESAVDNRRVTVELVESTDLAADLAAFLSTTLAPEQGPMIQLRLLRTDTDTLCIKISHLVADAGALKQYAYMLAGFYSNLNTSSRVDWDSLRGRRSMKQVMSQFNWRQKLQIVQLGLRNRSESGPSLNSWYLPAGHRPDPQCRYFLYSLGAERLCTVKAYGQQQSATVGDVMLAAFFLACYRLIPQPAATALSVRTTIDLRRYLQNRGTEAVCNLSAVIGIGIKLGPNATLNDAVSAVRAQMNLKKTAYPGLSSFTSLPQLFGGLPFVVLKRLSQGQLQPLRATGRIAPMLSNMGLIEPKRLQFGGVPVSEAFLTPSIPIEPLLLVGLTSFRDSMMLSVGFRESLLPLTSVKELFEHLDSVLP